MALAEQLDAWKPKRWGAAHGATDVEWGNKGHNGFMTDDDPAREQQLRELAEKLQFTVAKKGSLFTLERTADVSAPVRHEGLTLSDAEEVLNTWKLRGPHGG